MKILVTTPGGDIGRRVLRELLAPEFSVRVITPDPANLPVEIQEQAEVIHGSTDDVKTLTRALNGVESMFWCVPGELLQETDVRGHYEKFAHAGAEAIREMGTRRVVTISAVGKGLARNAGPVSALHSMEDILNESGAAIRHLRCGVFMENFLGQATAIAGSGVLSCPMPGDIPIPLVAAADVADAALRWLVRRDWKGVAGVAVRGPADLSYGQAASVMERILEQPVQYREASTNRYVRSLVESGASTEYARSRVEMFAELAHGIARAEPGTTEARTPTTLANWVENEFLPALGVRGPQSGGSRATACVCKL